MDVLAAWTLVGLALAMLWLVYARSIYARRVRLTWARVGVIWRVSRIAGRAAPPMVELVPAPDTPPVPSNQPDADDAP